MSDSVDLNKILPSKAKAWIALVGSVLSFAVPFILEVSDSLPPPWPALVGALVAVLTAVGVYEAPYAKPGTVLAPVDTSVRMTVDRQVPPTPEPPANDPGYTNPWRKT